MNNSDWRSKLGLLRLRYYNQLRTNGPWGHEKVIYSKEYIVVCQLLALMGKLWP